MAKTYSPFRPMVTNMCLKRNCSVEYLIGNMWQKSMLWVIFKKVGDNLPSKLIK